MAELSTPLAAADERYGEAIAWFDGQEQTTYRELSAAVMHRVAQLRHAGLRPAERVAFLPQADFSTLCAFWAVVACGAVACPISARFPADKQAELAARIGARWLSDYGDRTGPAPSPEELLTDDQAPATIILSSGSTGEAKAIVHSWQAHAASAEGALRNMPLGVGDRWVAVSSASIQRVHKTPEKAGGGGRGGDERKPPVSIPLPFDEAVEGLLAVDPRAKKKPEPKPPAKKKPGRGKK